MRTNLATLLRSTVMILAVCACAERDNSTHQAPPGGGKADDATCSSTCDVACSGGTCAVATQITTGGWHTCARLDDGSVWCWGSDWTGQLGLGLSDYPGFSCSNGTGSTPCRYRPHRLKGLPPTRRIIGGNDHTCAILDDDTVRCWGSDYSAVLGIGDSPVSKCNVAGVMVDCLRTPDGDPGLFDVADVAPGELHTCALTTDGDVWCWGTNGYGQLGKNGSASTVPELVPGLSDVKSIATGLQHTCALLSDTTVKCWGRGEYGQIGDGGSSYWNYTPTAVVGLTGVSSIALGDRHSCALLMNGDVACWGSNTFGQLGTGTFTSSLTPVTVSGLSNVEEIEAGKLRTCARTQTEVLCWGIGGGGVGGEGLGFTATTPCAASSSYTCAPEPGVVPGLARTTQLTVSTVHSCALDADGQVSCWGDNLVGSLGDGTVTDRAEPVPVEW